MNLKDALFKVSTGLHRGVFTVSNGRIFGTVLGMPVVKLVTIGRSSGKERSTMLTAPIADGDRLVLVASFGGDDRHPAWYRNLEANPQVRVTMGRLDSLDDRSRRQRRGEGPALDPDHREIPELCRATRSGPNDRFP